MFSTVQDLTAHQIISCLESPKIGDSGEIKYPQTRLSSSCCNMSHLTSPGPKPIRESLSHSEWRQPCSHPITDNIFKKDWWLFKRKKHPNAAREICVHHPPSACAAHVHLGSVEVSFEWECTLTSGIAGGSAWLAGEGHRLRNPLRFSYFKSHCWKISGTLSDWLVQMLHVEHSGAFLCGYIPF